MSDQQSTALVTGASSGLGVEFARGLAKRGHNLILTARREDRLQELGRELTAAHGIRVSVLPADLAAAEGAKKLFQRTEALNAKVEVLINNAGFGVFGPFLEQTADEIESMIQVNVTALTTLSRLFAERMAEQGGGRILQVASYAGLQPIPRYTVYSGAKAYVVAFSQALRHEMQPRGVKVCVIAPGFSNTEFHDVSNHVKTSAMKFLSLPPRPIAEEGLRGLFRNKFLITPGISYKINNFFLRFLPRGLASALSAAVVKHRQKNPTSDKQRKAA